MWLMTKHGFYSIVCAHDEKGASHKSLMMIRAREREHLEALGRYGVKVCDIVESVGTDYTYRVIVDREFAVLLITRLAEEVDYSNFKNAARAQARDEEYNTFLHTVWAAGLRLTPRTAPRSLYGMGGFWDEPASTVFGPCSKSKPKRKKVKVR